MRIGFRDGRSRTEARRHSVLPGQYAFELASVQQVALNSGDATIQSVESIARANQCRNRVPVLRRLANDLPADAACCARYQNFS